MRSWPFLFPHLWGILYFRTEKKFHLIYYWLLLCKYFHLKWPIAFFASNILILQCWANLTYFSVYKPAFFNLHILFNFWSRMIIKSISMFFKVRILIQVIFVLITVLSRVITVFYLKFHSGPKPTELWIGKKENVEKLCLRSLQLTLVLFPGFFMEVYVVGKAFTW